MPCDRVGCPNVATVKLCFYPGVFGYFCEPCAKIALKRRNAVK